MRDLQLKETEITEVQKKVTAMEEQLEEKDHSLTQKETKLREVQAKLENSTLQLQQDRESRDKETELQRFRDIEKERSKWEEREERLARRVKELEQRQKTEERSLGAPRLETEPSPEVIQVPSTDTTTQGRDGEPWETREPVGVSNCVTAILV